MLALVSINKLYSWRISIFPNAVLLLYIRLPNPLINNTLGKVRYLGSKARLVHSINELIGSPGIGHRFVDLFCGTGVVSYTAGLNGWNVLANDSLQAATILTSARMVGKNQVHFKKTGGYANTIAILNTLKGLEGFFYREYSISLKNAEKVSRPYFTLENARRIDAIREQINKWYIAKMISPIERKLLLADLIESVNQVANIAGTYGCFLKNFSEPSLRPLKISERVLSTNSIENEVLNLDAFEVKVRLSDTVYLDPPYTKRQYAAYYHIPETIAYCDEPKVQGVTGLRPWKDKASLFCYKIKAPIALKKLLTGLPARRILLSYSTDGHVPFKEVISIASLFGQVSVLKFENFERYAPNATARNNAEQKELVEYIVEINR
jgi:adenine-specific DNA-methyltransferase